MNVLPPVQPHISARTLEKGGLAVWSCSSLSRRQPGQQFKGVGGYPPANDAAMEPPPTPHIQGMLPHGAADSALSRPKSSFASVPLSVTWRRYREKLFPHLHGAKPPYKWGNTIEPALYLKGHYLYYRRGSTYGPFCNTKVPPGEQKAGAQDCCTPRAFLIIQFQVFCPPLKILRQSLPNQVLKGGWLWRICSQFKICFSY